MIQLTGNFMSFAQELGLALAQFDRDLSLSFEEKTKAKFKELVVGTPQWSGDLAAAWNYSISYPDETYIPIPNKVEAGQYWSKADIFQRGAQPAVGMALNRAKSVKPTWRDTVYFHNPAPIADKVENQRVLLRPVNLVDGHLAMVQHMINKYGGTS